MPSKMNPATVPHARPAAGPSNTAVAVTIYMSTLGIVPAILIYGNREVSTEATITIKRKVTADLIMAVVFVSVTF